MAIDFPNSPTVGQIYTSGDKSWIWDGTVWKAYGASLSPTVLKVDSTNSRVGINNQSPAYALDVTGDINASSALRIAGTSIGAWTTYTPTITAQTGTFTTVGTSLGKYIRIGKLIIVLFDITITTNGTAAVWINISKPVTSVTPLGSGTGAVGFGTETAVYGTSFTVREANTSQVLILGITAPSYVGANGARITGYFTYEAA